MYYCTECECFINNITVIGFSFTCRYCGNDNIEWISRQDFEKLPKNLQARMRPPGLAIDVNTNCKGFPKKVQKLKTRVTIEDISDGKL